MAARLRIMRVVFLVVLAMGLTAVAPLAADESTAGEVPETLYPLEPAFRGMTGDELFSKLLEHNRVRDTRLQQYSAVRTYAVTNDKGKLYAEEVVRVDYRAPDQKTFVTDSEKGSRLVRNLVLKRLIESES